jgi:hypothetical protein
MTTENNRKPWTPEADARLIELARGGYNSKLIGRELGRTREAVRQRAVFLRVPIRRVGSSPTQTLAVRILQAEGPMVGRDLARELGLVSKNLWRTLRPLVNQGVVHVHRYERGTSGTPKPVFKAGPGKNATLPKSLTRKQISKRYRERMKRERPAEYRVRLAKMNARKKRQATTAANLEGKAE